MTTDKIRFTKEKEALLMTLSSRVIQSRWKDPILRDPWAEEAMRHPLPATFDTSKVQNRIHNLTIRPGS